MHHFRELCALYDRHRASYAASIEQARSEARLADPATDGNPTLCHNWGNADARAAWQRHHDRTNGAEAKTRQSAAIIHHRAHLAANEAGNYLWCPFCQGAPMPATEPETLALS